MPGGEKGEAVKSRFPMRLMNRPLCVVFFFSATATMTDRKAVIKNADMSEDMQQDAVECATQALEKYNIEKDIAAFIKKVTAHFQLHPVQRRGKELPLWLKIFFLNTI